jgi:5-methylcytosine-specific restriction endonuclease McrA
MSGTKELSVRPKDEEIFQRDGFKCVYCGFDGRTFKGWAYLQVDHFKPRSLGGGEEASNLVTSCVVCNHMKGAKTWASIDEGKKEIALWWDQMRLYWEKNVKPLVK